MSNKTQCGYYNEDDFVENDEALQELTVTITLCEYRNLISERSYNEKEIEKLQDELADAKKKLVAFQNLVFDRLPEVKEKCKEFFEVFGTYLFGKEKGETAETEE